MACLECPICFLAFDDNSHKAMQTFCECKRALCLECINQVINHGTGCCPWDRTRWIGRTVLQKFRPAPSSSSSSGRSTGFSSSNTEELMFLDEMGEQAVTKEDQIAILFQLEAEAKAKRLKTAEDLDRSFAASLLQSEVNQRLQWRFKSSSLSMSGNNSSGKKRERPRTLSPFLKKKTWDIVDLTNDDDDVE